MMPDAQGNFRGKIVQIFRLPTALGVARGALAAVFGLAVLALITPDARAEPDKTAYLVGGLGAFDLVQDDDTAIDFRIEYRHGEGLWIVKPWAGIEATSDGAIYGLGGILADVSLGNIVFTPSFGVGLFSEGDGKDLGHTVEFRSQLELAYRFANRSRVGVAFSHISNAGLGDNNPGTEVINVYYALPLDSLIGQ